MDIGIAENYIENKDMGNLIKYLSNYERKSRGTPSSKIKTKILNTFHTKARSDSDKIRLADALFKINTPTSLELAAHLYAHAYKTNKGKVNKRLIEISNHDNWEVREWAAGACSVILLQNFEEFIKTLEEQWLYNKSENVRRAVVVTLKYVSKERKPEYKDEIFRLIEVLLSDESNYVKKNLGPFAIGDGLLKYYPDTTLRKIEAWKKSMDPNVRWNVIKIFSSAEGSKYKNIAKPIIQAWLNDPNKKVKSACKSTLIYLNRNGNTNGE
jgi:3-methyladenine DNA glycosylase AlkD